MQFALNGKPTWRAKRNFALCLFPTVAFLVGLLLVVFNRNLGASPDQAMILFGVRAAVAPLLAVVHLRWLKEALAVLADEGQLRP